MSMFNPSTLKSGFRPPLFSTRFSTRWDYASNGLTGHHQCCDAVVRHRAIVFSTFLAAGGSDLIPPEELAAA